MKMRKKLMCLLGSGMLIVALAGCGATEGSQTQEGQQESQQSGDQQEQNNNQSADGQEQGNQRTEAQQEQAGQSQEGHQQTDTQNEQPPSQEDLDGTAESQPAEEAVPAGESASIRIWGPVLRLEDGNLVMDNRSDVSYRGEMIIAVDPESTRILDGENGYPVEVSEINEGEPVFVYIGPAATMSEPPIVNASLILCKIPDDLRVPEQVYVTAMEEQADGSFLLSADNGMQYLVPADCEIMPYLTRNIVTLQDIQAGSSCLVWSDERRTAQKILLFSD